MRIEVIQEKFAQALMHINKAISNKPNIPVLKNVLLETEKGKLKLSSTNLEIGIIARIGADITEEGKCTVSAKLLSEFVSSLKPGKLSLFLEGQKFVVKSVDNSAEFFIIPAEDFPSVPEVADLPILKTNALNFANALNKTTFAASVDNSRPVLTGVLTKITKRFLTMVAVDGFRLSQKVISVEEGPEETYSEIIPAKTLQEVDKIIRDVSTEKDEVEIYALKNNNQVIFKIGDVELASRLIEGEFPAYEDILPKDKQHSFSVLKTELANAIKIVNIFARNVVGNKSRFTIDPEKNSLKLHAIVTDVGNNETSVDIANVQGDEMQTAYNARFLHDMLNSMVGDEIIYETNGVTAPGVFKDSSDDTYLHVIMPMRLE